MKGIAFVVACFGLLCGVTVAHMGITYPPPRNTADDQTTGPCGAETGDFTGTVTELTPGQKVDIILNANAHNGFYRLALSQVNSDTYDCVLIDHIPQRSGGAHNAIISVTIPDVDCQNCAIQAYMVTTKGTCCDKAAGECGTAWYACANVKITGTKPRNELTCPSPCTWAYRDEKPGTYEALQNNGIWTTENDGYRLNVSGGYYPPQCQTVTKSECPVTTTEIGDDDGESKTVNDSLARGGKLSAGGIVGIIVVILVLGGIGVTWFVAVRNKKQGGKAPMMAEDRSGQAVVAMEEGQEQPTSDYVRPTMPPPPPKEVN